MRWLRLEREITFQHTDSGLYELRRVVGWECSSCHHTNWAPRHPGVGCWSCGERDEEFGHDAIRPQDHKPAEVLTVQRPPDAPPPITVPCPTCGLTVTLEPTPVVREGRSSSLSVTGRHADPLCAAWLVKDLDPVVLYRQYLEQQKPQTVRKA